MTLSCISAADRLWARRSVSSALPPPKQRQQNFWSVVLCCSYCSNCCCCAVAAAVPAPLLHPVNPTATLTPSLTLNPPYVISMCVSFWSPLHHALLESALVLVPDCPLKHPRQNSDSLQDLPALSCTPSPEPNDNILDADTAPHIPHTAPSHCLEHHQDSAAHSTNALL